MRLDIGMPGMEKFFCPLNSQVLHFIYIFTAAVVASIGITFSIFAGFLINAGVVVGLLPTTGLPMPFISYGGSSLVFSALGIGILLNVSRQTKYVSSQRILRKMGI